eukprot:Opistho-2@30297
MGKAVKNANCSVPWTNTPYCDESFADALGAGYDALQGIYVALTVILIALTLVVWVRLVRVKGFRPLDLQKHIILLVAFCCCTFVIRAVDPVSWRGIVPYVLNGSLCYDLCSAAVYTILFAVVFSWYSVVARTTGRHSSLPTMKKVYYGTIVSLWLSQIVLSIGQATAGPFWAWNAFKMFEMAFFLGLYTVGQTILGIHIYRVLRDAHAAQGRGSELSETGSQSESSLRDPDSQGHMVNNDGSRKKRSLFGGKAMSQKRIQKRAAVVTRILKLLVIATLIELVAFGFEMWSATANFTNRYTLTGTNPQPQPDSVASVLGDVMFDIVQYVACVVTLYFFSSTSEKGSARNTSNNSSSMTGTDTNHPESMAS